MVPLSRIVSARGLLLLALALIPHAASAQTAGALDDETLRPLATGLADYLEARSSTVGLEEARERLVAGLQVLGAPAKEGEPAADPLRRAAELGRALWLSHRYEATKARTGWVVTETFRTGSFPDEGLEIAFRLPEDYDARERAWPLVLSIPDVGEEPAEHLREHWTLDELLDGAILVSPAMPRERAEWTRVMVNGRPGGLCHVLTALRFAVERFAVDPDAVFVCGRGKGVPAAIAAGNCSPQLFAGVVGRAGDADEQGPENFGNLPTLLAGGGARARAFQEAAEAAGLDNCRLLPAGSEADVWVWMQTHPRKPFPESVTVVPGDPFPTRAHWLRIAPSAPDARVQATIDRNAGTVRLEAHGAAQAILYLNDALVDLDRPVRVVVGDVERTLVVQRHLPTTLDLLSDGTSDAGCVYVAEVVIDLTEAASAAASDPAGSADEEYGRRLAEAEGNADALWALASWCASNGRPERRAAVLRRLLRLAPDHEEARAALGYVRAGERWFASAEALERYQRGQDEQLARERGLVKVKGVWMHPDERGLPGKGQVKDLETGEWLGAADRRRLEQGWSRQDLEWIGPEDAARVDDGLWRVDGEWLDLASADRRHARPDRMWCIPGPEVTVHATVEREVALRAQREMACALDDLRRVFGAEPLLPLSVAVLRDEEQYDRFAFGDPDGRRPATHAGRLHVIHSAFPAESWFERIDGKPRFQGMGVCYWDAHVPNGDLYGVHSARLAVGLSYVDALDPSPKAVREALADGGPGPGYYAAYQAEKALPAWLRYGGAVYAERFFRDMTVGEGGDPWWARRWSLDNLARLGGLRPLSEVLAFPIDPERREDGLELLIESGLVVAFLVDGDCEPVLAAHAELKRALASGRLRPSDAEDLTEVLLAHEQELRAFAGL